MSKNVEFMSLKGKNRPICPSCLRSIRKANYGYCWDDGSSMSNIKCPNCKKKIKITVHYDYKYDTEIEEK